MLPPSYPTPLQRLELHYKRHNRLFTRASWCHGPYGIIMSLRHTLPTLSHGMPTSQHSIARSFPLKQRDTFRFRLLVYSIERLREQNTNMAACDDWGVRVCIPAAVWLCRDCALFDVRDKLSRTSRLIVSGKSPVRFHKLWNVTIRIMKLCKKKIIKTINIFSIIQTLYRSVKWY